MTETILQHPRWDHRLTLAELIGQNSLCLLDPAYRPHEDDDGALPGGAVLLTAGDGTYTTLAYSKEGWTYVSDTLIGLDLLHRYRPMRTEDAIRLVEASAISFRG